MSISTIFSYFGNQFSYSEDSRLTMDELKGFGLVPSYDDARLEDHIRGSYADVSIELVEGHLTEQRGSGKTRRTVTVFRGMFVQFGMNKSFSGTTLVKKDKGSVMNFFSGMLKRLERIKLEDPQFEKRFEVFSSDQVEARYLLSTSFMERLVQFGERFGSRDIQAGFHDDKLLLMIPSSRNRFEVSSIRKWVDFKREAGMILDEMHEVFDMIDFLKIQERTGL